MVYLPHWPIPSSLGKRQIDYETVFERMSPVLEKLGNPHLKLPPVIHIAGTNGKGSASALIAKVFSCAGYKTHSYNSPHLHDCNERIILADEKISDSFLYKIMEEVRLATGESPLTFMEAFTIGAFLAFSKTPADILILECGMGGRVDATNIIADKLATLIMPISFDHTEYLGESIKRIALEKAMIMRPKTPLIVAPQPKEANELIKLLAQDQNISAHFYDEDFEIIQDEESGKFDLRFHQEILEDLPKPNLLGDHQYINFSTAIAAILAIKDNFKIDKTHIQQAISTVSWPNRLEKIENNLNKILKNNESEIWIDGAHNNAGAFALSRWISNQDDKKTFIICGFSKNKCRKEFLEKFRDIAQILAVRVNGEPYPESSETIVEIGKSIGIDIADSEDLIEAISYAAKEFDYQPCRIVICGSLHLARDVRNCSAQLSHVEI